MARERKTNYLGNYFRKAREIQELTLDEVEAQSRSLDYERALTAQHLSKIERGETSPSFEIVIVLAEVMGCDPEILFQYARMDMARQPDEPVVRSYDNMMKMGYDSVEIGDYQAALNYFSDAYRICSESGADCGGKTLKARCNRAICFWKLESMKAAENEFRECLAEAGGESRIKLICLKHLGIISNAQGEYEIGKAVLQRALDLARSLNDEKLEASILNSLGNLEFRTGNTTYSLNFYRKASGLYESMGLKCRQAGVLGNLGDSLITMGQIDEGIAEIKRALDYIPKGGDDEETRAQLLTFLVKAYYFLGDYEKAQKVSMAALRIAQKWKFRSIEFLNFYYRWKIAVSAEKPRDARATFRNLKSLKRRIKEGFRELDEFNEYLKEEGV